EANDQSLLFGVAHGPRPNARLRLERAFALLVRNQLETADQPEPPRLSDQRMLAERGKASLEMRRLAHGLLGDALAPINLDRLDRHPRRNRMPALGAPLP